MNDLQSTLNEQVAIFPHAAVLDLMNRMIKERRHDRWQVSDITHNECSIRIGLSDRLGDSKGLIITHSRDPQDTDNTCTIVYNDENNDMLNVSVYKHDNILNKQ
jgi:hypothetical protein